MTALFVRARGVRGRLIGTHASSDGSKTFCGLPVQQVAGTVPSVVEAERRLDCRRCCEAVRKAFAPAASKSEVLRRAAAKKGLPVVEFDATERDPDPVVRGAFDTLYAFLDSSKPRGGK